MNYNEDQFLYRYRPVSIRITDNGQTLEKKVTKELENQEIYFATINENNDPMDGLQEVYWDGDEVLWKNFLRHYCLCLLDSFRTIDLIGNIRLFDYKDIRIWLTPEDLKTVQYRELYDNYFKEIQANIYIQALLRVLIARKKLYKAELGSLLFLWSPTFIEILNKIIGPNRFSDVLQNHTDFNKQQDAVMLEKAFSRTENDQLLVGAEIADSMAHQINLISKYNNKQALANNANLKSNLTNFTIFFQRDYLRAAVDQVYPEYYVSCFSSDKENISLWSHYAERHYGICLVFQPKADKNGEYIEMENGDKAYLRTVSYDKSPPELNYFENIGHLSLKKLQKYWLSDGQNRSALYDECLRHLVGEGFWKKYREKISYKYEDWKSESESRALKHSFGRFDKIDKRDRLLRYKFEHLHGIVFGLRTTEDIKLEIMRIIDEKMDLHGRRDFGFYQTMYSSAQKRLVVRRLSLIKYGRSNHD